jgi:hypothetical protein
MSEEYNFKFTRDGDMWCCTFLDFESLAECPAGFGFSRKDALEDLLSKLDQDLM